MGIPGLFYGMLIRWLALFFLLSTVRVSAQNSILYFNNLNENEGLSNNTVNSFFTDTKGRLWIATYNGFNRFDGSNFYRYKIRKGTNSLRNEVVHALCEDRDGNIWGGQDIGVFRYNPRLDSFTTYEIKSLNRYGNMYEICTDQQGDIWAAGIWSLFKYNRQRDKFEECVQLMNNTDSAHKFRIAKNGFLEDAAGKGFWLATSSGLVYYDKQRHRVTSSETAPGHPLFAPHSVSALTRSQDQTIWYFDNTLLQAIRFNPVTQKQVQVIDLKDHLPASFVCTMLEDKNQNLWLCTWQYDMLCIHTRKQNEVIRIRHQAQDRRSIASTFFWDAFQDKDGTLWFGTIAGISRTNPLKHVYTQYRLDTLISDLSTSSIFKTFEDQVDQSIWIQTSKGNLYHFNPETRACKPIDRTKAQRNNQGQLPGTVNTIQRRGKTMILSTFTGSWIYDSTSGRLLPYRDLPKGYENFATCVINFKGDSVVYFNNSRELLYWNRQKNITKLIQYRPDTTIPKKGSILGESKIAPDGTWWAISYTNHLVRLSAELEFERIKIDTLLRDGAGAINSFEFDAKGQIWINAKGIGIYRYHPSTGALRMWNETDGLPGSRVHKIAIDALGRIWAMVYNKISVYMPASDQFFNFKIPYSENIYLYVNHLSTRKNGHVLGTINNDLFEFFPERILQQPHAPKPVISQVLCSGREINLFNTTTISLAPQENTLQFFFGSTLLEEVFPYDIEYKLIGAESTWTNAGARRDALYNNLRSGEYTFCVRVKGKNNTWASEEACYSFTIQTPFYKRYWFLLGLFLMVALGFYLLYRHRMQRQLLLHELQSKADALEKEKAMITYENLKQQLNPHFLFNSLTSLSSLIHSDASVAAKFLDSLSKTYRYILKSRDHELVQLGSELEFTKNFVMLQKTRFEEGLEVDIRVDEQYWMLRIVPVTLQNLLENAIKHNIIDEESPLRIQLYVEQDYLVVENNIQKKKIVETSNKQGLASLQSLYEYLSSKPVLIQETAERFVVKLPLIQ